MNPLSQLREMGFGAKAKASDRIPPCLRKREPGPVKVFELACDVTIHTQSGTIEARAGDRIEVDDGGVYVFAPMP